jgi:hypothetical protein
MLDVFFMSSLCNPKTDVTFKKLQLNQNLTVIYHKFDFKNHINF